MSRLRVAFGIVPLCALIASAAWGAEESGRYALSHVAGFDHIATDKFDFNLNTGDFTIPGHFTATRQGTDITADRATGNSKQKQMHAEGSVIVHQNGSPPTSDKPNALGEKPSTLTCDKLDVDGSKKIYIATGNMHYTQEGGREAIADTATLDDVNHRLHMVGHVHVRNGEETISADSLDYDTQSTQLSGNGNVTITAPVETPSPGPPGAPKPKRKRPF